MLSRRVSLQATSATAWFSQLLRLAESQLSLGKVVPPRLASQTLPWLIRCSYALFLLHPSESRSL